MIIKGFELVNQEKLTRAIDGCPMSNGRKRGGVGSGDESKLIAEYDKFGGLILKDGKVVKMGSFFDFKTGQPKAKPEIVFVVRVDGKLIEIPEGAEEPIEVKAARVAAENVKKEKEEKAAKKEAKKGKK